MEKRYFGINEMSKYLGITIGTLYVWACHKKIPYLKIGRLLKFDILEIQEWLKHRRIKEKI